MLVKSKSHKFKYVTLLLEFSGNEDLLILQHKNPAMIVISISNFEYLAIAHHIMIKEFL